MSRCSCPAPYRQKMRQRPLQPFKALRSFRLHSSKSERACCIPAGKAEWNRFVIRRFWLSTAHTIPTPPSSCAKKRCAAGRQAALWKLSACWRIKTSRKSDGYWRRWQRKFSRSHRTIRARCPHRTWRNASGSFVTMSHRLTVRRRAWATRQAGAAAGAGVRFALVAA